MLLAGYNLPVTGGILLPGHGVGDSGPAVPVNPVLNTVTFTAGTGGNPPVLDVDWSYTGSDARRIYMATVTNPSVPSAAQIIAGSGGGVIEAANFVAGTPPGQEVLDFLTAASEAADEIHVVVAEVNNGGVSNIVIETGVVIDATDPAFSSGSPADGSTDAAIDATLTLTATENIFEGAGNFYIYEDGVLAETVAVSACTFPGNTTVTIPHADFTNDVDVSIRWDAGAFTDASGNDVAVNSGDTLWNFQSVATASIPKELFNGTAGQLLTSTYVSDQSWTWSQTQGTTDARIDGSGGLQIGDTSDNYFIVTGTNFADGEVECEVEYDNNDTDSMDVCCLRHQGASNGKDCYLVRWHDGNGEWQFRRRVNNGGEQSATTYSDAGFKSNGQTRKVRLKIVGTTAEVFIDDVLRITQDLHTSPFSSGTAYTTGRPGLGGKSELATRYLDWGYREL